VVLKAILFDFNGVIINDESIHGELIDDLLLSDNLSPLGKDFWQVSIGRSDRSCIPELWQLRGRSIDAKTLDKLIAKKSIAYRQRLEELDILPIYPELVEFVDSLHTSGYKLAVVTGAMRSEVDLVLSRSGITRYFETIVAADDIINSKPDPEGYLLAVDRLNKLDPNLNLLPSECLAIEDTFPGIQAVKSAGMQVCAIAHTYPFHMLQRLANWTVDRFSDLELDRVTKSFN
jgi:beta-phosphoglucomutase